MSPGRTLLALVAVAAGLAIGIPLLSNNLHKLGAQGWFHSGATKGGLIQPATPTPQTTPVTGLLQPAPTPAQAHRTSPARTPRGTPATPLRRPSHRAHPGRRPIAAPVSAARQRPGAKRSDQVFGLGELTVLLVAAIEIAGGVALTGLLLLLLVLRRARRRCRRRYGLYELHLSTHDQAKPQDLEDLVEQVANIVRAFPAERLRNGQPYLAVELICGEGERGMEWSINVRCEPSAAAALDGAFSAAYPDVRLGRRHHDHPTPRPGRLRVPGHVMRFRKQRRFVYPLLAAGEELGSPPLEQIARAQVALGEPSIVRFQLTPTPSFFEHYARRAFRRHEQRLAHHEHPGLRSAGVSLTLNRTEMQSAGRAQNRSLFWLETAIAADNARACKTIAAAVQSRRGENRLHRRITIIRQRLYRRRFPNALGPLLPSTRSLVSAAEVAHLLALPTARMKGVPVRRVTLPRIPVPPQAMGGRRARRAAPTDANRVADPRSNGHTTAPAASHHVPSTTTTGDKR